MGGVHLHRDQRHTQRKSGRGGEDDIGFRGCEVVHGVYIHYCKHLVSIFSLLCGFRPAVIMQHKAHFAKCYQICCLNMLKHIYRPRIARAVQQANL